MDSELLKGRADLSCGGVGTNDYREKTKRIGGDGAMDRRRDPRAFFLKKNPRVLNYLQFLFTNTKSAMTMNWSSCQQRIILLENKLSDSHKHTGECT
jgi:hypothetical protein